MQKGGGKAEQSEVDGEAGGPVQQDDAMPGCDMKGGGKAEQKSDVDGEHGNNGVRRRRRPHGLHHGKVMQSDAPAKGKDSDVDGAAGGKPDQGKVAGESGTVQAGGGKTTPPSEPPKTEVAGEAGTTQQGGGKTDVAGETGVVKGEEKTPAAEPPKTTTPPAEQTEVDGAMGDTTQDTDVDGAKGYTTQDTDVDGAKGTTDQKDTDVAGENGGAADQKGTDVDGATGGGTAPTGEVKLSNNDNTFSARIESDLGNYVEMAYVGRIRANIYGRNYAFSIGYGPGSITLNDGTKISWDTFGENDGQYRTLFKSLTIGDATVATNDGVNDTLETSLSNTQIAEFMQKLYEYRGWYENPLKKA
jgi:hypothetical protein